MKRLISLILCLILGAALVACGEPAAPENTESEEVSSSTETDTPTGTSTDTKTNTTDTKTDKTDSDKTETPVPWEGYAFDTEAEHKFLATDIKGHSIVLFDLNKTNGDLNELKNMSCIVWTWNSDADATCKIKPGVGIDAAKYRYSPYYKKDVIIACSSGGGAYVIDYQARKVLWEYNIGDGPHSIEMMPNGDVVVAASGNGKTEGKLVYIPLSAGKTNPSSTVPSPTSHGVMYDPEQDCLWVMENTEVACFKVAGAGTANAQLQRVEGGGGSLFRKDSGGHVLSPVIGQPGIYWVGCASKLWQFNSKDKTVTDTFPASGALSARNIKGIASFADGTAVLTVAGLGGKASYDWSSGGLRFMIPKDNNGTLRYVFRDVPFSNREFYKVFPFTKDYQ